MEERVLQYSELCLQLSSFTAFTTINNLFNCLEAIFSDPYRKKNAVKKFSGLEIGASLFINFYSEFIRLGSDLEYSSEMLVRKHKLTSR